MSCCVEFPTSSMEMEAVADKFDRDGDGFIDYKEFIAALRPERAEVTSALQPFDAHCCHLGTATKHPVPDWVKPSLVIFDIRAL